MPSTSTIFNEKSACPIGRRAVSAVGVARAVVRMRNADRPQPPATNAFKSSSTDRRYA
jgi:hypothetical protein